jgi:hypothetical protein
VQECGNEEWKMENGELADVGMMFSIPGVWEAAVVV